MTEIGDIPEKAATFPLILALSKGRILQETLPLLSALGIELSEDPNSTRKLILPTDHPALQVVIIRATDVPTYVRYGAADLGVAGKDVLMEQGSEGLYEPLDLQIACCRLMIAKPQGAVLPTGRLRVATKYVNITRRYFADQGRQVEVIKLYGSMELAPLVGLADCIVDVVGSGDTLRANGLEPVEPPIAVISSRLIVNRASLKMKQRVIQPLMDALAAVIARPNGTNSTRSTNGMHGTPVTPVRLA